METEKQSLSVGEIRKVTQEDGNSSFHRECQGSHRDKIGPLEQKGKCKVRSLQLGFPGGTMVKNPPANTDTQVQIPVQEDRICQGAAKPACQNYLTLDQF